MLTAWRFTALHGEIVEDRRRVAEVLRERDRLREMLNEETGVRGYVATGDPLFLDVYYSARARVRPQGALQRALQEFLDREVALVRRGQRARAVASLEHGKYLFDRFRGSISPRISLDQRQLNASLDGTAQLSRSVAGIAVAAIVLVLLALAAALFTYWQLHVARRLSRSDPLTGLPNRREVNERIERWLAEPDARVGLIYLDLDGFKKINDLNGHAAGDGILRLVAERLRSQLWGTDIVARMGGDEFLCVLGPRTTADALEHVAQRLHHAVTRPYHLDEHDFVLGCSCGWTLSAPGERRAGTLLEWADRAMYRAKAAGGGVQQAFSGAV